MITVHFCIHSCDPRKGGMEFSALRIIRFFERDLSFRFVVYVLSATGDAEYPPEAARVVNIGSTVNSLLAELGDTNGILANRERTRERTRLQVLLLHREIERELYSRPSDKHVVLSFYLSTAGFVAQHVSNCLELNHIACSRGSDLGRDLFTHDRIAVLEFLVNRAFHLVTTCEKHADLVRKTYGKDKRISIIYNSLPPDTSQLWTRNGHVGVTIVSLGGFSVKKGTASLLSAVSTMWDDGWPVRLLIAGPTGSGQWSELLEAYVERYANRIQSVGQIEMNAVATFLLQGDIYCSSSLSEGCSNATMLALGLGMPIVSTRTGALVDLARDCDHVVMVSPPADVNELGIVLRRQVSLLLNNQLEVKADLVASIAQKLSLENEKSQWSMLLREAAMEIALGEIAN